ncbi:TPA: hypothetical protein ACHVE4_000437 [Streptococcus suis]
MNQLLDKTKQLEARLEKQPQSQKIQNPIREFSDQAPSFEICKVEARDLIQPYDEADAILARIRYAGSLQARVTCYNFLGYRESSMVQTASFVLYKI